MGVQDGKNTQEETPGTGNQSQGCKSDSFLNVTYPKIDVFAI